MEKMVMDEKKLEFKIELLSDTIECIMIRREKFCRKKGISIFQDWYWCACNKVLCETGLAKEME